MTNSPFYVGLDLGQAQDYSALTVVEQKILPVGEARPVREYAGDFGGIPQHELLGHVQDVEVEYHLRYLHRFRLGTAYPEVAARTEELLQAHPLGGRAHLVVDATGVGRPVVDMLRERQLQPVAITITGGDQAHFSHEHWSWSVPKRELVSTLQIFFQSGALAFAEDLPELEVLIEELRNFKTKIRLDNGTDTYEAWRERDHDDLVLSLALAIWYAERRRRARGLGGFSDGGLAPDGDLD